MNNEKLLKDALEGKITEDEFVKECFSLPAKDAVDLIKVYGFEKSNGRIVAFFTDFAKKYPDLIQTIKDNVPITRGYK